MAPSSPFESTGDRPPSSSASFRVVFGLYVGVLVAGAVTAVATLQVVSTPVLVGIYLAGFVTGSLVGVAAARIDGRLPIRFGRSRRRRTSALAPAVPFGVAAVAL